MSDEIYIPTNIFAKRPRSVYSSQGIPFYIFAPDYRQNSAGIRVLHYLCHTLNEFGEEAYLLNAKTLSPNLRTPQLTLDLMRGHFLSGRHPVTIYPEVVYSNPLNTPLIARWLLNTPGHLGKPVEFEPKDIICYYDTWCLPSHLHGHLLRIDPLDHSVFNNIDNPHDSKRSIECYYANKYFLNGKPVLIEHQNLTSLGQNIKRTPQEIASILRKAKVLYCYEPSALIAEALACGCPVILVRSDYWKLPPHDSHLKLPGVAVLGEDGALELARQGLNLVQHNHKVLRENSWLTARNFIEAVYAAQQDLLDNGKPILNEAQDLWKHSITERTKVLDKFDRIYSSSSLLLKAKDSSKIAPAPFISRYREFIRHSAPQEFEVQLLAERVVQTQSPVSIHFLVGLRPAGESQLAATLDGLNKQLYPNWKVTVVSDQPPPAGWIEGARTQWLALKDAAHIDYVVDEMAAASVCDWIALLQPGTILASEALLLMVDSIQRHPNWRVLYADEDVIQQDGEHAFPHFKPGFNLELLRSCNYLGNLVLVRKDAFVDAGRFGLHQGAQTYDLALRLADRLGPQAFGRLSRVVVHMPVTTRTQTTHSSQEAEAQALWDHLTRQGLQATVQPGLQAGTRHVQYQLSGEKSIAIVLLVNDELDLVRHFLAQANTLPAKQVCVLDIGCDPDMGEMLRCLAVSAEWSGRLHVHTADASSWTKLTAEVTQCEFVYMTTPHAAAPTVQQLAELVGLIQRGAVAAVAPRLVLSGKPGATVINADWSWQPDQGESDCAAVANEPGPLGLNLCTHEKLAVNRLPLLLSKAVFHELDGFDVTNMSIEDAVVDFCARLARVGHKLVWTPYATLECLVTPQGTLATGSRRHLLERHARELSTDPCLHPMWSLDHPGQFEHHIPLAWTEHPSNKPRVLVLATDGEPANDNSFYVALKRWQDSAEMQLVVADMRTQEVSPLMVAKLMPDAVVLHASNSATVQAFMDETRRCLPEVPIVVRVDALDFIDRRPEQTDTECRPILRRALRHATRVVTRTPELARLCDGLASQVWNSTPDGSIPASKWLSGPHATELVKRDVQS